KLRKNVGIVNNGVNRIETQTVETIFLEPVERIVDEIIAHGPLREIDRGAPGGLAALGEKLRGIMVKIIPLGPEMIVDDVQHHHEAVSVRGVYEGLEIVGRPILRIGGEGQYTIIAPVARTRKIRNGHQFEGGDAEICERGKLGGDVVEATLRRERADVEL